MRDQIEDVFCKIPPPKPSVRQYSYRGGATVRSVAPTNMSSYMNAGGGCFDGDSIVKMIDKTFKPVKNLKKGDIVFGGFTVTCVVKTLINGKLEMVNMNDMLITPWHPVYYRLNKLQYEWVFPIKILSSTKVDIDYIYNIVLDSGHTMIINDITVVTLGHDFKDNNVVQHDYYGSDKVINDLKKINGWDNGMIVLDKPLIERGPNGHVIAMSNNV